MKKLRWVIWFLVIAFLWLVISRLAEIETLISVIRQAKWEWVLVAACLQGLYYVVYSGLCQSAFDTVEVKSRLIELIPVLFSSIFLNAAAPLGGTSGTALFMDDARRRGESPARAAAGSLLVQVTDLGAFLFILFAGIAILFVSHDLRVYEVAAALVLVLLVGGLSLVLLLGIWRPDLLIRLLTWIQRTTNRLVHLVHRADLLAENWADRNAAEFSEAALAAAAHRDRLLRTLGVALLAHLIDLLSLWTIFLAFRQPVGVGVLIAGYAIGILFWVVSITPQGIGVVEGMLALVLTSLGIPAEQSAVIALTFRGLTFWIPLLIGFLLLNRIRLFRAHVRPLSFENISLRVTAVLVGLMGVINVLSAVSPSLPDRLRVLRSFTPLAVLHGGRFTAAVAGFGLIILANGLRRRKRAAWLLAEAALLISVVSHLIKGLDYEEAAMALALAVWLAILHPHYHARSDPPSIRQGLVVFSAAAVFTLLYGVAGFYLLDNQFQVNFSLADAIRQTAAMFFELNDPGLVPVTGLGRYFAGSIYGISIITFFFAGIMFIRPVLVRQVSTPEQRRLAQETVERYGRTSLAAYALLPDKSYFFSEGGSLVQYVVKGRVALTLGDPIGPEDDFLAAVRQFKAFCTRNDWIPSFYQVQPAGVPVYEAEGFQTVGIGQEAVVDLDQFTLEGRENKGLRSAWNKLNRLGYRAAVRQPPHAQEFLSELREISDEWLAMMHGTEKRFSLGWFDEEYLNRCPIMVITDQAGSALAFTNIVAEYQRNEVSIDLMRHRPAAEHGVMDFLFVSLFQWAHAQGIQSFNLGLSSLSGLGEPEHDSAIERVLHYIYEHVNRFYNFKGLYAYKAKFHPEWSPRYLVYPDLASLPLVAIAMIRADSGDDWFESYFR